MHRSLSISSVQRAGCLLAILFLLPGRAAADNDLAFTAFPTADPSSLAGGQILQARGGLIAFQRGITAQSLYLVNQPMGVVLNKLNTWNPASHPVLKVWMHQPLPAKPALGDFAGLQTLPDNSSVKSLIDETEKLDPANPGVQVSQPEAALLGSLRSAGGQGKSLFANAWSQILLGRINQFLSGGESFGQYHLSGETIDPKSEIFSLMRSNAQVYARFHPLLAQTPLYKSTKLPPTNLYYESFDVEGSAVLGTGAVYQSQANGGPVNPLPLGVPVISADLEYYLNNGIYVSVELEQLSTVTVNGREATLVWRDDLVSTSNIAYLHGTERLASGMIMLQDVKDAIDAFRSELK
jgi:hypothetical protein